MGLVYAFLVGAIVCMLGQLALMYLKLNPLLLIQIAVVIGALLNPFGINDVVTKLASGYGVLLPSAGGAIADSGSALAAGAWQPLVMLLILLVVLAALSTVFGLVRPLPHTIGEAAANES